jgi:hypothetical protein
MDRGGRLEGRGPTRLTAPEGRKFGLTVGGAFAVLAGIAVWRGHMALAWTLGSLAALMAVGGVVVPSRMGPVHDAWMGLARAISKVTTPIVMGIMYYLMITPMGLLRRTLGRHPLRHPVRDGGYWVERSVSRGDLERQF